MSKNNKKKKPETDYLVNNKKRLDDLKIQSDNLKNHEYTAENNYSEDNQNSEFDETNIPAEFDTEDQELKIKTLQLEVEDWKERALRQTAELQNLQRQHELDILNTKKKTKKNIAKSVLIFLTTLNLAFNHLPEIEDEKFINFVETLKKAFIKSINDLQLDQINVLIPNVGDTFDPQTMQILNPDKAEGKTEEELKIESVVSLGLILDNQLIQPISIIVS